MKRFLLTAAFIFGITSISIAQTEGTQSEPDKTPSGSQNYLDDFKSWSISFNLGFPYSNMDLWNFAPGRRDRFDSPSGGLTLGGGGKITKYFNPFYGFYVAGNVSYLNGTSGRRGNAINGLQYRSWMLAGDGGVTVNFLNAFRTNRTKYNRHALLASAGAGLALYNPELYRFDVLLTQNRRWINSLYLALDGAYKYQLNSTWDLDLGAKAYFFETDGIDGITFGQTKDRVIFMYLGATYNFSSKDRSKDRSSIVYSNVFADMYDNTASVRRDMNKLTRDTDGDGIPDFFDKDNNTPAGVAVDGSGRPLDVDGDGIPDYLDEDPFSNKGAKVDAKGRELDSDGDGVPDSQDLEPNTPKGALVDVRGRQIRGGGGAIANALLPQPFFATNSASISSSDMEKFAVIARVMNANPNLKMRVVGHTDKTGSEAYNRKLGERRAKAAVDYMVRNFGIDASRFEVESAGQDSPLSPKMLRANRRVEFLVKE